MAAAAGRRRATRVISVRSLEPGDVLADGAMVVDVDRSELGVWVATDDGDEGFWPSATVEVAR